MKTQVLTIWSLVSATLATPSFAKETAFVLPQNISRARVVSVMAQPVTQTYNDSGRVEDLSRSLNRTVTVQDFKADPKLGGDVTVLVNAINSIQPGLGDQLASSNLYNDLSINAKVFLAAYEYGMTDRLSLGIRVPVVNRDVKAKFRAEATNNAAAYRAAFGALSDDIKEGLTMAADQYTFDTRMFEKVCFTDKGYEIPHDFNKTELGDVEFGGKYKLYGDDAMISTGLLGFRVPTGSDPSLTNLFDKGTSNGAYASALQYFHEFFPTSNLTVGGMGKLTYYFADTKRRAVPKNEGDSLPSVKPEDGQVQDVSRQQAPLLESELSLEYKFGQKAFSVWGAYQYLQKGRDKFSGPGNLYYEGLAKNTEKTLTTAEVGVGYSTIPAFRKKKFSVPLEVTLLYSQPVSGRNSALQSYGRVDFMVYF